MIPAKEGEKRELFLYADGMIRPLFIWATALPEVSHMMGNGSPAMIWMELKSYSFPLRPDSRKQFPARMQVVVIHDFSRMENISFIMQPNRVMVQNFFSLQHPGESPYQSVRKE